MTNEEKKKFVDEYLVRKTTTLRRKIEDDIDLDRLFSGIEQYTTEKVWDAVGCSCTHKFRIYKAGTFAMDKLFCENCGLIKELDETNPSLDKAKKIESFETIYSSDVDDFTADNILAVERKLNEVIKALNKQNGF